jgi:hypothetical protein
MPFVQAALSVRLAAPVRFSGLVRFLRLAWLAQPVRFAPFAELRQDIGSM